MTVTTHDRNVATRIWAASKLRQDLDAFLSAQHLTQAGIDQLCETLREVADVLAPPPFPVDAGHSLRVVADHQPDDRRGEEAVL